MKLPRVRFTIRRLMIAVAAIGTALGVGVEVVRLKRHCDQCLVKANEHASAELGYLSREAFHRARRRVKDQSPRKRGIGWFTLSAKCNLRLSSSFKTATASDVKNWSGSGSGTPLGTKPRPPSTLSMLPITAR